MPSAAVELLSGSSASSSVGTWRRVEGLRSVGRGDDDEDPDDDGSGNRVDAIRNARTAGENCARGGRPACRLVEFVMRVTNSVQ